MGNKHCRYGKCLFTNKQEQQHMLTRMLFFAKSRKTKDFPVDF